ncbi:MAG: insulinase family protein, partial [Clostridiales bacterium]|nr:insulinase family protein [Clostridiales bacterium]
MKKIISCTVLLMCVLFPMSVMADDSGFVEVSRENCEQYDGIIIKMKHEQSGVELVYYENADTEKTFGIGFRTPATDNTGVNHILEHCLLESSEKAEHKPFSYLLNHSGATFLNAMTFPDFTYYALASRDENEYRMLITTYLDNIFFPSAMKDENIFKKEGWRKNGDIYNGTVYNEMKGAYSDDETYLSRAIFQSLFPDTAYKYDSGGSPEYITELTYDNFRKVYEDYYHPGNAVIILYGKQDLTKTLNLLNERYLSDFDLTQAPKKPVYALQQKFDDTKFIKADYVGDGAASVAVNFVTCERGDAQLTAKTELLAALLADRNSMYFHNIIRNGL